MTDDRIPFLKFKQYAVTVEYKIMTPRKLTEKLREMIENAESSDPEDACDWHSEIVEIVMGDPNTILAALEAYEPWVSVEERLPEIDRYVLWGNENGYTFVECIDKDDTETVWIKTVTHWKPLPKPPEGE